MDTIYIRLLNEDIDVWRPVAASKLRENEYLILPLPDQTLAKEECWEFIPGDEVQVHQKISDGIQILVAVSKITNQ